MSILIKGMEMPTSCFQCEFCTKKDPDNLMCIISQKTFEDRFYHIEHRDESCPLAPVPPHGRLIDADKLQQIIVEDIEEYSELDENGLHSGQWCGMMIAKMEIEAMPIAIGNERTSNFD